MRNCRDLKISTEAGRRLSKNLDTEGLDYAMDVLTNLLLKHFHCKITKRNFDYYPEKRKLTIIGIDPIKFSSYSGIDISKKKAVAILKNLGFNLKKKGRIYLVKPPSYRTDILLEEDLIEEVIRIYGFYKIPSNQPPALAPVKNITPKRIVMADKISDFLSALGFDETLSLPLTKEGINKLTDWRGWEAIRAENSVNEEFPDLRGSLEAGLVWQRNEYLKKNVSPIRIFEIGAVFGKENKNYKETVSLGILISSNGKGAVKEMKSAVERILRLICFSEVSCSFNSIVPLAANPYSFWKTLVNGREIGVIYKLRPESGIPATVFSEIDLLELEKMLGQKAELPVKELESKLVVLDANVELAKNGKIEEYLKGAKNKIGNNRIWDIIVSDAYELPDKVRYTIRVSYVGLSDAKAKEIHLKTFNLKNTPN
jgi:phenylalanyl-tRNA synthetase beta chain